MNERNVLISKIAAVFLTLSAGGVAFIQQSEGTRLTAYDDSLGIQTICTGHTKGVVKGQKASLGQCEQWLKEDASEAGKCVARYTSVPLTQSQYDALVSFTFNLGCGAYKNSTLLKKINADQCLAAGKEFLKWDKGRKNGKLSPMAGLTKRRQVESEMFISGCEENNKIPE